MNGLPTQNFGGEGVPHYATTPTMHYRLMNCVRRLLCRKNCILLLSAVAVLSYFGFIPKSVPGLVIGRLLPTPQTLEGASRVLANAVKKSKTIKRYDGGGLKFGKSIPRKKDWDVCIVGAGLSGSVIAERYASVLDKTSLVMESRTHIVSRGGICLWLLHAALISNYYCCYLLAAYLPHCRNFYPFRAETATILWNQRAES